MSLSTWLRTRSAKKDSKPAPRTRLGVQQLEDRTVPSSWLAQIGGPDGEPGQYSGRGAADADGNTYRAGYVSGTVDFDPSADGVALLSDTTYVAKYTAQGALAWVRRFESPGGPYVHSIAIDPVGNPYLYGNHSGTTDFGGGWVHTSGGEADPYVLRLNRDTGATTWARVALGSVSRAGVMGVGFGADGCVYATGSFRSTADFDPGNTHAGNADLLTAAGTSRSNVRSDAFLWKLNAADGGYRGAWKVGGAD
ncbi:MAG TPA: hypothetical protein VM597_21005, partial [Gemmataceae bacterium]|nr:hypothetical protein [Gemmataceae bacterium]